MKKICNLLTAFRKTFFILCALVGSAIVTFGIVPQLKTHRALMTEHAKVTAILEEDRLFSPVHKVILSEAAMLFPQGIPIVIQEQRPPADISELISIIGKTAKVAQLELVNVTPYPDSFARSGVTFKVGCEVRGNYKALQKFLLNIGTIPTLHSIDEMITGVDTQGIHCSLQLRFAVHG